MLLRVLADVDHDSQTPIENSAHACLADEIHNHTVLYIESAKALERTKFWDAVPGILRPRYKTALERALTNGRVKFGPLCDYEKHYPFPALWIDSKSEHAIEDSSGTDQISLDDFLKGMDYPFENNREHLHPNAIAFSQVLAHRRHLACMGHLRLRSGLFRHEIWRSIFSPYACELKKVTLCDRYCLQTTGIRGLEYLISKISRTGCTSLNIYSSLGESARGEPCDRGQVWHSIRHLSTLGQKSGVSIGISLGSDDRFKVPAHDRYIRFQDLVFDLGNGITLLSDKRLRAHYQLSMCLYDRNVLSVEQTLRREQEISFELPFTSEAVESEEKKFFLESFGGQLESDH